MFSSIYDLCFPLVDSNNNYLGASFKWDKKFYITCKHVVNASQDIRVVKDPEKNSKSYAISNIRLSKKYDLCLFEVNNTEKLDSLMQLPHSEDTLSLMTDVVLLGFTSSIRGIIEPRCIKSYIHRAMGQASDWQVKNYGLKSINEILIQIPKGFSGCPVISHDGKKLLGMGLGTNASENNSYTTVKEKTGANSIRALETVETKEITYYGMIHSVGDISEIVNSINID